MESTCGNSVSSSSEDKTNLAVSSKAALKIPFSRHVIFWTLATIGCITDLATKQWAFAEPKMRSGAVWWLWEGHVGFQQSLNEGGLFGFGQGHVKWIALFSLVALVGIPVWLFRFGAARDRWLVIILGCILGGVLGNLYDRLGWHGLHWEQLILSRSGPVYAVRDWILWCWDFDRGLVWPNFNIADSLLVGGAMSLMLHAYLTNSNAAGQSPGNEPAEIQSTVVQGP